MTTKTKFVRLTIILASLAALPACWTYSLHPLHEDNDQHLIYDPALEGKWQHPDADCPECLLVITRESKSLTYTLQVVDSSTKKCDCGSEDPLDISYEGHIVQLGSARFLDAVPSGGAAGMGFIPAHHIFKLIYATDSLSLVPLSDHWLCHAPEAEQASLGECVDGDFVLTAPTDALQDFVQNHVDDEGVFPTPSKDDGWHRAGKPGDSK